MGLRLDPGFWPTMFHAATAPPATIQRGFGDTAGIGGNEPTAQDGFDYRP